MARRKVEKKHKTRLTEQQKELADREKAITIKAESLQKEQQELFELRRKMVMQNVNSFGFNKDELDAFVSALDGFKSKQDLAVALVNAAQSAGKADMAQFTTKLIRLGFT